jgi:hypothetical protein
MRHSSKHLWLQHYVNLSGQLHVQTALRSMSGWAPEAVGARWPTEQVLTTQENCVRPSRTRRQSLRRLNYVGWMTECLSTLSTSIQDMAHKLQTSYLKAINIILYKWVTFYIKYTEKSTRFEKFATFTERLSVTRVNGDRIKQWKWNKESDEANFQRYTWFKSDRKRKSMHAAIWRINIF